MAFVLADRVLETSTSTGTGSFVLAGARDGYQSFTDALANGDTTYYTITDGTDWEVGLGTWTESSATLARTTVLSSSNSGSAVNFGAGTKEVFISYPSGKLAEDTTAALLKSGGTMTGDLTVNATASIDDLSFNKSLAKRYSTYYTGTNYINAGEYQKIATITPSAGSQNTYIRGIIAAQSGQNIQECHFIASLRSNTLPDLAFTIIYHENMTSSTRYIDLQLWTKETSPASFVLVAKGLGTIYGNITADFEVIPRYSSQNNTISVNEDPTSEVSSIDTGFTANDFTKITQSQAASFNVTGNISVSGTVDGRDVAADGTKLDGIASSATANPNAIDNVVEDTSPQLGGNLDANGYGITLNDAAHGVTANHILLGNDSDLDIYHAGTASVIGNYTGDLFISNVANDADVKILSKKSSNSGATSAFVADGSTGESILYHDGTQKLATKSTGIQTSGTLNINGAYSFPTTDGTNGQVLTTDGSGAVTFADASGGGSSLTIKDEGTALSTAATAINFTGSGVTATGTGAEKTVNIPTVAKYTEFDLAPGATSVTLSLSGDSDVQKVEFRLAAKTTSSGPNNVTFTVKTSGGTNHRWDIQGMKMYNYTDTMTGLHVDGTTDIYSFLSYYNDFSAPTVFTFYKSEGDRWTCEATIGSGTGTTGTSYVLHCRTDSGYSYGDIGSFVITTGSSYNWTTFDGTIVEYFK